ncbi:MAG: UDP-N-acetylmuramoyl-L-alanyl-D-glutamate--2,6-diaminopimelate ligase [Candidatus Pelagibacter bacterium]|nr:UDP-N-acetylmuramoyl-L-alanyl-D-glutamate--2,6-diaminopimelate ligase [Candidatus Pelagibacter bacterium]MBL6861053.1 UDP-N-acetylmuramoyl-L-alanyl-D-glutamate--2,6-diaminopimelate ligase [Candidatus Pelagibacter bacterium]
MLLKKLIKNIPKNKRNIAVSGISTNSKEVRKNFIFFAIKGKKLNGEKFIKEAIKNRASVIICSKKCKFKNEDICIIKTEKIRSLLSFIASKFYKDKPKNIISVTGTNGKTSVADLFYQLFRINNVPVASIGTLGIKYNNKTIKTNLTSPDTIQLHKYLSILKNKKINNVIIEASSHGLDQKRLHNIKFKGAVFTNFSQDHLDYHKTMNSYLNTKLMLFKNILNKKSTIISDKKIKPFEKLKKIARKRNLKLIDINNKFERIRNISAIMTSDYKVKNLAMAIEAAKLCGLNEKRINFAVKKLKDISGRLELVRKFTNKVLVFIDYAHTPDALIKTLESLKNNYGDNITLVFGCGGDRDKKKRVLMAKIANENCKKIFVTDDNPRSEDPKNIRNQLLKYISKNKSFNIGNRSLAIRKAIKNSGPGEIILIAGKGHEERQIYKNRIYFISDKKIVNRLKLKSKIFTNQKLNYLQNNLILNQVFGKRYFFKINGFSIDSRTVKKNNLFLAIKGERNNGNKFINQALKKGAGCAVSTSAIKYKKTKIIKIKKPILFLNKFAKLKREYSIAKIIAVTGSAGKTSLKNLLKTLLQEFGKTYSSPKSFNNHYGVPLSLSNLSFEDKFGIFEVGMSKSGEIRNLTKLIKPHIGIITNIGEAHLENFKNISGIAKAKSEIIENIATNGIIILNRDDKFFNFLFQKAKSCKLKVITFGTHKKSDICLKKKIIKKSFVKCFVSVINELIHFETKDFNIYNILASLAVLKALKINIIKVIPKLKTLESTEGRGKKHFIQRYNKKFKFIDESYNANPLSVKNAIKKLNLIKKNNSKKYLILGDMLELGPKSNKYHKDLSKVINNSDIDKVFVKGKKTIFTYKHLKKDKRGNILQNSEDIDLSLKKMISNNDYLMIKGSNATGLNDFSKKLIKGV